MSRDTITAMNRASQGRRSGTETIFNRAAIAPARLPPWAWAVAGLLLLGLLLVAVRPRGSSAVTRQQDSYGSRLVFSDLQMSESTSLSGGKSTFVDGKVSNTGDETVVGASLEVAFANDEALPAQTVALPLTLIRTHEPYVDTVPVAQAPLAPGDRHEFRLIFEGVGANWNQQLPLIRVVHVTVRCDKSCG